jgi:hypothetical protein
MLLALRNRLGWVSERLGHPIRLAWGAYFTLTPCIVLALCELAADRIKMGKIIRARYFSCSQLSEAVVLSLVKEVEE